MHLPELVLCLARWNLGWPCSCTIVTWNGRVHVPIAWEGQGLGKSCTIHLILAWPNFRGALHLLQELIQLREHIWACISLIDLVYQLVRAYSPACRPFSCFGPKRFGPPWFALYWICFGVIWFVLKSGISYPLKILDERLLWSPSLGSLALNLEDKVLKGQEI